MCAPLGHRPGTDLFSPLCPELFPTFGFLKKNSQPKSPNWSGLCKAFYWELVVKIRNYLIASLLMYRTQYTVHSTGCCTVRRCRLDWPVPPGYIWQYLIRKLVLTFFMWTPPLSSMVWIRDLFMNVVLLRVDLYCYCHSTCECCHSYTIDEQMNNRKGKC